MAFSRVFFKNNDARVKGQKTTKDREVFILYDDFDGEQFCMANGIVREDYFHELLPFDEGLHISSKHYKIESIGTAENLKEQKAEKEIKFCVASKNYLNEQNNQDVYGFFPNFVLAFEDVKSYENPLDYDFYIFYFGIYNALCGLIHVASLFIVLLFFFFTIIIIFS